MQAEFQRWRSKQAAGVPRGGCAFGIARRSPPGMSMWMTSPELQQKRSLECGSISFWLIALGSG